MKTRFWRFAGLMLGLLMFARPMIAQARRRKPDPCKDTSNMTQGELNECALKDLHKAETILEGLLKDLRITQDSPEQSAWEAYRDAQLAALYPPQDISSYGSVPPMCLAILKKKLTAPPGSASLAAVAEKLRKAQTVPLPRCTSSDR